VGTLVSEGEDVGTDVSWLGRGRGRGRTRAKGWIGTWEGERVASERAGSAECWTDSHLSTLFAMTELHGLI
jgi:hypothetical protein